MSGRASEYFTRGTREAGSVRLTAYTSPGGSHPVPAGGRFYAGTGPTGLYVMVYESEGGKILLGEFSELTGAKVGSVELEAENGVASAFAGLALPGAAAGGAPAPAAALVAPTGWRFVLAANGLSAYLQRPRLAPGMG